MAGAIDDIDRTLFPPGLAASGTSAATGTGSPASCADNTSDAPGRVRVELTGAHVNQRDHSVKPSQPAPTLFEAVSIAIE